MPLAVLLSLSACAFGLAAALGRRYPSPMVEQQPTDTAATALRRQARTHPWLRGVLRSRLDPQALTGLALTLALGAAIAGGLALGALAYLTRSSELVVRLDRAAGQWGADNATEWSTRSLGWITHLGDTWVCIAIAVVICLVELARERSWWIPAFVTTVVLGSVVLVNATKEALDRVRPEFNPIAETLGPSFPSGHSAMAAAFWAAVALLLARRRSRRTRTLLSAAAVAIAVAVAGSRVLLGVHWLSDVVAGVAFGWGWFALCSIAFGGRLLRLGAPVAEAARSPIGRTAPGDGSQTS
jgi:undecaprenyl-diphosphatase